VFLGKAGGFLNDSAMRRRYHAACEMAGLERMRFRDLRHTFGSLAINKGSLVQVQHWLGHANSRPPLATCITSAGATRRSCSPARFGRAGRMRMPHLPGHATMRPPSGGRTDRCALRDVGSRVCSDELVQTRGGSVKFAEPPDAGSRGD
jgi:hypothetical protein